MMPVLIYSGRRSLLQQKILRLIILLYPVDARLPAASMMDPHLSFRRQWDTTFERFILRRLTSLLPASKTVSSNLVTRPMQMSKRSSSRQQVCSNIKKNFNSFSIFMVPILILYSFQRIWKYFLIVFQ